MTKRYYLQIIVRQPSELLSLGIQMKSLTLKKQGRCLLQHLGLTTHIVCIFFNALIFIGITYHNFQSNVNLTLVPIVSIDSLDFPTERFDDYLTQQLLRSSTGRVYVELVGISEYVVLLNEARAAGKENPIIKLTANCFRLIPFPTKLPKTFSPKRIIEQVEGHRRIWKYASLASVM